MKCPICNEEMENTVREKSWKHDHSSVLWFKLSMKKDKEIERLKKIIANTYMPRQVGVQE